MTTDKQNQLLILCMLSCRVKIEMTKLCRYGDKHLSNFNNYFNNLFQAVNCRVYHCDIDTRIVITVGHSTAATSGSVYGRRPFLSVVVGLFAQGTQLSDVVIGPSQALVGGGLTATTHTTQHNTLGVSLQAAVDLVDL